MGLAENGKFMVGPKVPLHFSREAALPRALPCIRQMFPELPDPITILLHRRFGQIKYSIKLPKRHVVFLAWSWRLELRLLANMLHWDINIVCVM